MEQQIKEHTLRLEKNTLTVTAVNNVENFDSKQIVATLSNNKLIIKGEELCVIDLDINSQNLVIKGNIFDICYAKHHEKVSFMKRIFK